MLKQTGPMLKQTDFKVQENSSQWSHLNGNLSAQRRWLTMQIEEKGEVLDLGKQKKAINIITEISKLRKVK